MRELSERDREATELEVDLLKKLRHTNIVTYKESFIDDKDFYNIVMVFCSKGDLYSKIENSRDKGKNFSEDVICLQALLIIH